MRAITIFGPSHSGKSTLAEALVDLEGGGDNFDIPGVMNIRTFGFLEDQWISFDIAGGAENLAYAGQALAASDMAVLCVPPEADAAVLAAPYLRLLDSAGIPFCLFINRMDTPSERVRDIVAAVQGFCSHSLVLRQIPIREGGDVIGAVDLISERAWEYHDGSASSLIALPDDLVDREHDARNELLESLADFDDAMLEQLIEDRLPATEEVYDLARRVVQHSDLVSVFLGSASHVNGINRLMKALRHEAPGYEIARDRVTNDLASSAVGFTAEMRKHLGKILVIRALGPGVLAGKPMAGSNLGSLTRLDAKSALTELRPGEVGLALKADHLIAGRLYSETECMSLPGWTQGHPPGFCRIISPIKDRDDVRLSTALDRLCEIDPTIAQEHDETTGKPVLVLQGPMQAGRLQEKLAADFGIQTELEPVSPAYRETISKSVEMRHRHRKQSGGAGQFADVVLQIHPQPRGAGFRFQEQVKGGAVPKNYIPSVASGAGDALRVGPNGFPVVDVGVMLLDGKHHSVDSSDHAFRTAGKNAVRGALEQADSVVLQPIMRVDIHVPTLFAGGLAPTISGLNGQVLGFEPDPEAVGWDVFSALIPAAAQDELFRVLGGVSRGTAWFQPVFDHYREVSLSEIESKVDQPNAAVHS